LDAGRTQELAEFTLPEEALILRALEFEGECVRHCSVKGLSLDNQFEQKSS